MSAKVMGRVWDLELPHNEMLILLAMADHADHEGGNIFPGVPLIAHKTGYSVAQVQRVITLLTKKGILVEEGAESGKRKQYRIDFSKGVQKPEYKPKRRQLPSKAKRINPYQNDGGQNATPIISTEKSELTPIIASLEVVVEPSVLEPSVEEPTPKPQKQPIQMPAANSPLDMYTAYKTLILEHLERTHQDWLLDAYSSKLIDLANRMSQKGYTVEDVTNTLRYKIKDRIAPYSFYYLEKDIPAYRSQQLTMHNTDAYKDFVPPPIPVITEEQRERALKAQAEYKAERAKESAA